MDIDKIIEGLSGKRKQACEVVSREAVLSEYFWDAVADRRWSDAASYVYGNGDNAADIILADMLWEG